MKDFFSFKQVIFKARHKYQFVTLIGGISRFITLFLQLAVTRILIGYLGVKDYAFWSVLASFMVWMALLEIGIGPAFQNYISYARVEKHPYENRISEVLTFLSLLFFFNLIIVGIVGELTIRFFLVPNYGSINSLRPIVLTFLIIFTLKGELEVIYNVYFAEHKGYISFLGQAISILLGFFLVIVIKHFYREPNIFAMALAFYLPSILVPLFLFLKKSNPSLFKLDFEFIFSLIKISKKFLAFKFLADSILLSDYLVMTKILVPEDIVKYNVLSKVFNIILFFYSSVLLALWPVSAEFIKSKRIQELNTHVKLNLKVAVAVGLLVTSGLLLLKEQVFNILTKGVIKVDSILIFLFGIYIVIRIWSDMYAMLLQSSNYMDRFLVAVLLQAILTIFLEIFLAKQFGVYGIVLGLILGFVLTVGWFLPYEYNKITQRFIK